MANSGLYRSVPGAVYMLALLSVGVASAADDAPRPNIVFIMADDLGWADVGFHGGRVSTPNLDRLRSESVELTRHYVYPVCSPTRSALLSGRYASRFGVVNPQNERAWPWDTVTLPRALQSVGYDTGLFGKWHLGSRPEWGPQKYGFDYGYGSLAGGVGPWDHRYKTGPYTITWHRNAELVEEEGHVTDLITNEAINWLTARGDAPFFLYVPFTAVHIPIREPEAYFATVPADIAQPSHREYAACIAHLDAAVGKLLEALARTGKADNTLLVFTSDNGGTTAPNNDTKYPPDDYAEGRSNGNNHPYRGQKGTVYEGGTRVPTLVRWPAQLKPGEWSAAAHVTDWMPTFCALAGYEPQTDLRWDGRDLWPTIAGKTAPEPRSIYIAGPGFRSAAVHEGDWKLVVHRATGGQAAMKTELFHLSDDPYETQDRAAANPAKVQELEARLVELSAADRDSVAND